ncbi:hypothetical protein BJX66DRAFT_335686 [Aspergillus keveii]|uniref:Secreted protein n=1 Tax=Aspergillus keveii TaxID=714993 RepID=A0ABR4GCH5_9EURO
MRYLFTSILPTVLALAAYAHPLADPTDQESDIEAINSGIFTSFGAPPPLLNGTAEEINPTTDDDYHGDDDEDEYEEYDDYDDDDQGYDTPHLTPRASEEEGEFSPMGNGHDPRSWCRSREKKRFREVHIRSGIKYLRERERDGDPAPSLRARSCKRVSCSYDVAIGWCNDSDRRRELPSWINIADGAQAILDACGKSKEHKTGFIEAELNHFDDWRVRVYEDSC